MCPGCGGSNALDHQVGTREDGSPIIIKICGDCGTWITHP